MHGEVLEHQPTTTMGGILEQLGQFTFPVSGPKHAFIMILFVSRKHQPCFIALTIMTFLFHVTDEQRDISNILLL